MTKAELIISVGFFIKYLNDNQIDILLNLPASKVERFKGTRSKAAHVLIHVIDDFVSSWRIDRHGLAIHVFKGDIFEEEH